MPAPSELLRIKQEPTKLVSQLPWVSEAEVAREPSVRRASVPFAYNHGGQLLRRFLDIAENLGVVEANSVVMVQRNQFRSGAYSTPAHFHSDVLQGHEPTDGNSFRDAINDRTSNRGLIACVFDTATHPDDIGTLYLEGGELQLDMSQYDPARGYIPNQNMRRDVDEVPLYWWHFPIQDQLAANSDLVTRPLRPNGVYAYTSENMHRVPQMRSSEGARILFRINTPNDPTLMPSIRNTHFEVEPEPSYVFRPEPSGQHYDDDRIVGGDVFVRQRIV